jgi:hypothetical protein
MPLVVVQLIIKITSEELSIPLRQDTSVSIDPVETTHNLSSSTKYISSVANGHFPYVSNGPRFTCMSGLALIGAVLAVMILNVLPSTLPVQLTGQVHLLYVLTTLFIGVVIYKMLSQ